MLSWPQIALLDSSGKQTGIRVVAGAKKGRFQPTSYLLVAAAAPSTGSSRNQNSAAGGSSKEAVEEWAALKRGSKGKNGTDFKLLRKVFDCV